MAGNLLELKNKNRPIACEGQVQSVGLLSSNVSSFQRRQSQANHDLYGLTSSHPKTP